MATVDVEVYASIARPRSVVAAYCCDPDNATSWYANIDSVRWETAKPMAVGSRFTFSARFLGRTLNYSYEVVEWIPEERFVMRTAQGPFPMETTYEWEGGVGGSTLMRLRNRGEPRGFSRIATPIMSLSIKRATTKDLRRLKGILESG
jgi:Polyketide cyclase / dehydrase and lipid transport